METTSDYSTREDSEMDDRIHNEEEKVATRGECSNCGKLFVYERAKHSRPRKYCSDECKKAKKVENERANKALRVKRSTETDSSSVELQRTLSTVIDSNRVLNREVRGLKQELSQYKNSSRNVDALREKIEMQDELLSLYRKVMK
jgi:hypothetical protein